MKRTESGGGVVMNGDRVAVVCQRGNAWSLPKGHVEEGETLLDAARREIREECGVSELSLERELGTYERAKIGRDPGTEDPRELKRITLWLFTTTEKELEPEDPKITDARWVPKEEVGPLLTHPKDRAFYESLGL